jgi:hypothetical protein
MLVFYNPPWRTTFSEFFRDVSCEKKKGLTMYAGFRHPDRMATDQKVRRREHFVPHPCWYFTILHGGRHFRNFSEMYPVKKRKSVSRKDEIHDPRTTDPVLYP